MWFGVACAVVLVVGGIAVGFLAWRGVTLDRESKAFADESVLAIVKTWDQDELLKRASASLRQSTSPAQTAQLFARLRATFGALTSYDGSNGQASMTIGTNAGTRANYSGKGHFEKGDADVQLTLVREGGAWTIEGFHFNSPVLFNKMTEPKS